MLYESYLGFIHVLTMCQACVTCVICRGASC